MRRISRTTAMGAATLAALVLAAPAQAQERQVLGFAITGSNDDLLTGQGIQDRWRTVGLGFHVVTGTGWGPQTAFGDVLEFRLHSQIFSPQNLENPAEGDRPYAGAHAIGVHAHWVERGLEMRLGAEAVITGPQTGLSDLQEWSHDLQGLPDPSNAAEDQIGDAAYLRLSSEVARTFVLSPAVSVRPFGSSRIGDETFGRLGVDVMGGSLASGGLKVRDDATGQLMEGTRGAATRFGWSAGLDVAVVGESIYLPDEDGFPGPEDTRIRARVGAMWAGERWSVFAGTAWLSEEFEGQSEPQMVGALGFAFGF